MKEVEKNRPNDVGKLDIPDVSGGISYIDDGCYPAPIGPGFPGDDFPPPPEYPRCPGGGTDPIPGPSPSPKA